MSRTRLFVTARLIAAGVGLGGLIVAGLAGAQPSGEAAAGEERLPIVQFAGHDSKITTERFVLVDTREAWVKLWGQHTGAEESLTPPTRHVTPAIDFSRYSVAGYFHGTGTNRDGEIGVSVRTTPEGTRVRFEASTFQSFSAGPGPDTGFTTRSFGLWVIEKPAGGVIFEEARGSLKNEPVRWVEVGRANAP